METVSIRLKDPQELDSLGRILKENRSEIVRDLLEEGKKMKALTLYKNKKISLGLASKFSGLSLSEFLDLLEEYHITINLSLEDEKQAMKYAKLL